MSLLGQAGAPARHVGGEPDYADVPPSRGVFEGTAAETLEVAVTIREP